ncbi:SRPBCC family protein [Streptomyces sp. NPDC093252]|uniref:SRPBCC family protein n=1 Tax=Streptomyces sp. NPDC093252 TaxID=3154980 RepID=UPI003428B194
MPSVRATTTLAVTLALTAALTAVAVPAQAEPRTESSPDRHGTPSAFCRGQGVDPAAKIRYETGIVIDAPLSTIWKLQTDIENWPTWQPPVHSAERLDSGKLRKGARFHWTTPVPATPTTPATTLGITSTVQQLKEKKCLLWTGPAIGEGLTIDRGVHLWTFTKVKDGVLAHTEETWTGAQVEADVPLSTAYLGMGLEAWLGDLKAAAEGVGRSGEGTAQ